jgi:dTDP-4-dehydrorhamnose 3,5-epimerase
MDGINICQRQFIGYGLAILIYFVNKLYDYNNPDEIRRTWNDLIVPESINGNINDSRVGKPWDWMWLPHK